MATNIGPRGSRILPLASDCGIFRKPVSGTSLLAEGLWRFQSEHPGIHQPCNGYIVRLGGKKIYLIDPPTDLTREVIQKTTGWRSVARIFLTHVQNEHGAGTKNFPGTPVHVPAGDEYLCHGLTHYENLVTPWPEPWEWETRGNFQGHLGGARNERPLSDPVELAESLVGGKPFEDFQIVSTPGHGKNAVTLVLEIGKTRVAFTGDLIYGNGQIWNWYDADWDYGPQTGQKALLSSAQKLAAQTPHLLCPSHGPVVSEGIQNLEKLQINLAEVLTYPPCDEPTELNFPEKNSMAPGFRELTPHIHQWKTGNTIVLTSDDGRAIIIDDGLCLWEKLPARVEKHDMIFAQTKAALGIRTIDWIIPTHYHGDHTELIPHLAQKEQARVLTLNSISGPMKFPENYNLACPLPWYGTVATHLTIHEHVPEGYCLEWAEYRLTFFHLGGQTKYHLGIEAVIDGLRVLFVGDAWWGTSTTAGPVLCWNDSDPESSGWIYAIDRMIERAPDLLVCGHGSALRNPLPYLQKARSAWTLKMASFKKLNPRASSAHFFSPFVADAPLASTGKLRD